MLTGRYRYSDGYSPKKVVMLSTSVSSSVEYRLSGKGEATWSIFTWFSFQEKKSKLQNLLAYSNSSRFTKEEQVLEALTFIVAEKTRVNVLSVGNSLAYIQLMLEFHPPLPPFSILLFLSPSSYLDLPHYPFPHTIPCGPSQYPHPMIWENPTPIPWNSSHVTLAPWLTATDKARGEIKRWEQEIPRK